MKLLGAFFSYLLWATLIFVAITILFLVLGSLYFKWYFSWELKNRRGLKYYGRPLGARKSFKRKVKIHAFFLKPVIFLETRLRKKMKVQDIASITYDRVQGPSFSCTRESFKQAAAYQGSSNDIFIVTQMKCGTTWMQQVVFQILTRGQGTFNDHKYKHLSAISPWIEAINGVSITDAPLIGTPGRKIVKTHLPTTLCPYNEKAKYIYVVRHPVSCFGSIMDYFKLTAGPFSPPESQVLQWFCSDRMWWLPWPEHVGNWWEWSETKNNIFFVSFEQMKKDPISVIEKVSTFMEQDLELREIADVLNKSSFEYMKQHEQHFEMVPPNLFSVHGTYFKSGKLDRDKDVSEEARQKIVSFCIKRLANRSFPISRFYPDIVSELHL